MSKLQRSGSMFHILRIPLIPPLTILDIAISDYRSHFVSASLLVKIPVTLIPIPLVSGNGVDSKLLNGMSFCISLSMV